MIAKTPSYRGYRFPSEIISHAVWLYYRFCLSFRDVEDLRIREAKPLLDRSATTLPSYVNPK